MKLTSKQVKDYMMWRTDEQFRQCPYAIADACNDDNITAKDLMKLLFFNDPIPSLHTHSYGFNTATGRNIIQTLEIKYYEFINTK